MGTFDFLSRIKRTKDGGVDFGIGTGKEIKLIIGVEKARFIFVRKFENITKGRERT